MNEAMKRQVLREAARWREERLREERVNREQRARLTALKAEGAKLKLMGCDAPVVEILDIRDEGFLVSGARSWIPYRSAPYYKAVWE